MGLTELPNEFVARAAELLPAKDIKYLRLVSKAMKAKTKLNIKRIFLSPNRTSIDVFRSIVDHAEFAQGVREIIWDDARLEYYSGKYTNGQDGDPDEEDVNEDYDDEYDTAKFGSSPGMRELMVSCGKMIKWRRGSWSCGVTTPRKLARLRVSDIHAVV